MQPCYRSRMVALIDHTRELASKARRRGCKRGLERQWAWAPARCTDIWCQRPARERSPERRTHSPGHRAERAPQTPYPPSPSPPRWCRSSPTPEHPSCTPLVDSQARARAGRAHRGGRGTQRPGRCRERPRARLRGMVRRLQPARGPAHCRRPSGVVCASSGQTAHRANPSAVARCHQRRALGTVPPHRLVIRARWQPRAAPAPPASRSQPGITCTAAPHQISLGDGKARGWADGGYRVRSATTRLGRCGDHPPGRLVRMVHRHQPPRGPAR